MPYPINPTHRLLLEDNASYLLLEDNSSKLILDEQIALDDPLNAATVSTLTPGLSFVGVAPPAQVTSTPAWVQSLSGTDTSGTGTYTTAAFSTPTTVGNTLIASVADDSGAVNNITSITDSKGNIWSKVTSKASISAVSLWSAPITSGGSSHTITVHTNSVAVTNSSITVQEFSGLSAVAADVSAAQSNASSSSIGTATTALPTQDTELVIVGGEWANAAVTATSGGTGYSNLAQTSLANANSLLTSKVITTAATQNDSIPLSSSSGGSDSIIATFKAAITSVRTGNLTYEVQVDTVNTFDSTTVSTVSTTTAYYFDASDAGPTDPNAAWSNDANAFDNDSGPTTSAGTSTAGSSASNFLRGDGTNAPISGGNITAVNFRFNHRQTGSTFPNDTVQIYTASLAEMLGSISINTGPSQTWTNLTALSTPSGGWTWQKINNLVAVAFMESGGSGSPNFALYKIEIQVTYDAPVLGPLLDNTSDLNTGFIDDTTTALGEDRLLLEDNSSYLLLEDNSSKLAINYSYPSQDYITYTVPASTLSNGVTYYWRARQKVQNGGAYTGWSEIRSFTVSAGGATSASITQLAATLTFSGGTQAASAAVDATIAQSAATLTFSGGTQSTATVNKVAISQVAASIAFAGGTQAIATVNNTSINQSAATLTFTGGTQAIATVNKVALSQVAATLTFTGGTQAIATSNFVSVAQLAGTITFAGGTQAIVTTQSSSVSQLAATVTFTGGTQAIQSNAIISQSAATLTFSGGTQAIATIRNVAVSQLAGTVTFSGGTHAIATVNDAAVSQVAGTLTFSGGTQVVASIQGVAIAQTHATLTFAGGTQAIAAIRNASVAQVAGAITFTGGTQSAAGLTNASVVQTAASLMFTGGTQTTAIQVGAAIAQVAATITFMGGVPTVIFNPPPQFGTFGIIISSTDQLGTLSDIASTNIAGGDIVGIIADSLASASQAGEDASLSIDDSTQNTTLQG